MPSKSPQAGIKVFAEIPGIEQIRQEFLQFGKYASAKYMAAGIRKAVERAGVLQAIKENTPRGPTGNLRRSVGTKSKTYVRTGVGLVIVGYKAGRKWKEPFDGTKLGYHQGLVEFGTKPRYRRTKDGRQVSTGKMPVGGRTGRPPIRTAWEQKRALVEANMLSALQESFDNAAKELAWKVENAQRTF